MQGHNRRFEGTGIVFLEFPFPVDDSTSQSFPTTWNLLGFLEPVLRPVTPDPN